MEDINALTTRMKPMEEKGYDVTMIYSKMGTVKARLFCKEFIRNESARPSFIDMKKGLHVEFFDDSSKLNSTLSARNGRYYDKEGNIIIRDSVVVHNNKGERLDTEELVWNQKLEKFYTEKFVKVTTPTNVFYGDGMEANQDFSWYRIRNLKGKVQIDKKEMPGSQ